MNDISSHVFYILLSLALKPRHGYEIMKESEDLSCGRVKLGPGTLYGAIKRMLSEKLIEEVKGDNARRRYYQLTEKGRANLQAELKRYEDAVTIARQAKLLLSHKLAVIKTV